MKKITVIALSLLLCMCMLLTACGSSAPKDPEYPVWEAVDLSTIKLESAHNAKFKVQYPADTWTDYGVEDPLTIAKISELDTGKVTNVNIQQSGKYKFKLDKKAMDELVNEMGSYPFMTFNVNEMRQINGNPVIYAEGVYKMTNEAIDFMIKNAGWTEADIKAMGGREALLAIPPATQMYTWVVTGGYIYVCVGTYYDEPQKAEMAKLMTVIAQTLEASK